LGFSLRRRQDLNLQVLSDGGFLDFTFETADLPD